MLDSAELRRSDNADTDSEYVASVVHESSEYCASKPSERRTVRILPAPGQNHQRCLSSPSESQADVGSASVIDKQESVRIRVCFLIRACFIFLTK